MNNEENLFQTLWPGMMQHTRLLLVDYDVCRYHSYDMMQWQLAYDSLHGDPKHFMSIRKDLRQILDRKIDEAKQVRFAQVKFDQMNIYNLFERNPMNGKVITNSEYENKLKEMFRDKKARITPTDISYRFSIVFNRQDITGYLLRYKDDPHKPDFYDQVTPIEVDSLLDIFQLAKIVQDYHINAIMMSSSELVIILISQLIKAGYRQAITFICGRYAYNYQYSEYQKKLVPKFNDIMGELEISHKHEFGVYEPFTGLAHQELLQHQLKEDKNNAEGYGSTE